MTNEYQSAIGCARHLGSYRTGAIVARSSLADDLQLRAMPGRIDNVITMTYSGCIHKMPETRPKNNTGRGEMINLRASARQKGLIDRAAEALGRSRSEFMLDIACREAESVLLDRRYFALSEKDFKQFTSLLDGPPQENTRLRRLLETKSPWDPRLGIRLLNNEWRGQDRPPRETIRRA
jgi:uncharacterized protein (DUF1778 family)